MKKAIKTILGIIVFSSLFGMSYAFGTKDISPILRDYLFFGGGVLCCASIITLGILVIVDGINNSKLRKQFDLEKTQQNTTSEMDRDTL